MPGPSRTLASIAAARGNPGHVRKERPATPAAPSLLPEEAWADCQDILKVIAARTRAEVRGIGRKKTKRRKAWRAGYPARHWQDIATFKKILESLKLAGGGIPAAEKSDEPTDDFEAWAKRTPGLA